MSYGYDTHYPPAEYVQPQTDHYFAHPDSAAAQLGLTPEEIKEVVDEQERWMREEYPMEEAMYLPTTAQHQRDNGTPAHTTQIEPDVELYEGYGTANEPPETVASPDNDISNGGDPTWSQPPSPVLDAQPLYQPPDHDGHGLTNDNSPCTTPFEYHEHGSGANAEPDHDTMIEQLTRELFTSDNSDRNWAEEIEQEIGLATQGEFTPANYSPTPAPPPPASVHPPPPPTSDYKPPCAQYRPPYAWYDPPRTRYTPQHRPFRPYTHPQRARRVPLEKQRSHVIATRRERFRATTRVERDGPPRYVAPALRGITGISRVSQLPLTRRSKGWRDPPPHKDPPARNPNRSDSPNWRAPSPNRPASFRSSSPHPKSPPIPPTSPLCPDIPLMPPQNITGSQLTSDLVSLIKTTSEALQNIVHIAAQLMAWSLCEDTHGNAVHSQPPAFPSGRGVPVTGSLGGSEAIA